MCLVPASRCLAKRLQFLVFVCFGLRWRWCWHQLRNGDWGWRWFLLMTRNPGTWSGQAAQRREREAQQTTLLTLLTATCPKAAVRRSHERGGARAQLQLPKLVLMQRTTRVTRTHRHSQPREGPEEPDCQRSPACSAEFGHASAVLLEAPVELASRTAGIVQLLLACCLDDHVDAQSRKSRGPEHDDP